MSRSRRRSLLQYPVAGGTLYRNCLMVGASSPLFRPLSALAAPLMFPDDMGRRWLQHNVEEVGNLEHFLPQLYETERSGEGRRSPSV